MYIPTQQERYRKVASITLFLCVIIPSAVVYWLATDDGDVDIFACLFAFIWPIAKPLDYLGFNISAAMGISAFVQACAFFWLVRVQKLTPKVRLTIAVTWGMFFALLLKLFFAFDLRRQVSGK